MFWIDSKASSNCSLQSHFREPRTSLVKQASWTRTMTSEQLSTLPLMMALGSVKVIPPSVVCLYPLNLNLPWRVGRRVSAMYRVQTVGVETMSGDGGDMGCCGNESL